MTLIGSPGTATVRTIVRCLGRPSSCEHLVDLRHSSLSIERVIASHDRETPGRTESRWRIRPRVKAERSRSRMPTSPRLRCVHRPVAAKSDEDALAKLETHVDREDPGGVGHRLSTTSQTARAQSSTGKPRGIARLASERAAALSRLELDVSVAELVRVQIAKNAVSIRHCRTASRHDHRTRDQARRRRSRAPRQGLSNCSTRALDPRRNRSRYVDGRNPTESHWPSSGARPRHLQLAGA